MTAALLRNELFHHLLASNPERTRTEDARAGALALAGHIGIALLLLQLPTTKVERPVETIAGPIVLLTDPVPAIEPAPAAASGAASGGAIRAPAFLPPAVLPDVPLPGTPITRIGTEPTPMNVDPSALVRNTGAVSAGGQGTGGVGDAPFKFLQNPPRMLNAAHVSTILRHEYPPMLMQSGIGGTVVLHVLIDLDGRVIDSRVVSSSGYDALDAAALRVSREMRFTPAQNREHTVRVWAEIPIVFSTRH